MLSAPVKIFLQKIKILPRKSASYWIIKTSFFAQNQDFHSEKHRGNYGILHFHNFIRKFSAFATPKHIISPIRAIELPSPAAPAIRAIPGKIPVFLLPIGHDEIQVTGENAVLRRRRRNLVIYISTRITSSKLSGFVWRCSSRIRRHEQCS